MTTGYERFFEPLCLGDLLNMSEDDMENPSWGSEHIRGAERSALSANPMLIDEPEKAISEEKHSMKHVKYIP